MILIFSAPNIWAESNLTDFSKSSVWQKLYQYKKNKSKIESQAFFFSNEGKTDPYKELISAIEAYKDTSKLYGTLQLPAACAFPARKRIIESHLGLIFPVIKCKDLEEWIRRIDADQLAIDFAGAYSGNPASILGHTFLRFYKEPKRFGEELLSYAVGFLAVSHPGDSRALYMIRGLTGQYPGYYQIEPFYMKVGIYNNSESRDIWEQKLNFTPEEVRLSLELLWEYSFNAEIPYYFADENCSYRMLSLLEIVRPDSKLTSRFSAVVLPADTVRALLESGIADTTSKFRASVLRRLKSKVNYFSESEKSEFEAGKKGKVSSNPKVLDALIDYWTYTNYRAETHLSEKDAKTMEDIFLKRATLPTISSINNDEELKSTQNLIPTYFGHKTSWVSLSGGTTEKLSYRMGAHALTDAQSGYDDIAAIEYLGFDLEPRGIWSALLVDVKSIEPLNVPEKKWSWLAKVSLDNDKNISSNTKLILKGGGGGAYEFLNTGKFYFMPSLKAQVWMDSNLDGLLSIGFESGVIFHTHKQSYLMSNESNWNRWGYFSKSQMTISHHMTLDHAIFASFELSETNLQVGNFISEKMGSLGYKIHF